MTPALHGTIALSRRLATHDVWLQEPFSRGQAWADLLLLANDTAREMRVRGVPVQVRRGQVGWSILGLSQRWRWSAEKARAFLTWLQDQGMVTVHTSHVTTLITLINYDVYQSKPLTDSAAEPAADREQNSAAEPAADREQNSAAEPAADREQNSAAEPAAEPARNRERGIGIGKGEHPLADTPEAGPVLIPADAEVQSYCEAWPGDLSRGIPAGIPEAWWLQWLAKPRHTWPRNWQQALVLDFTSDWIARRPKAVNGSGPARSLVPENTARQAGDIDWWWTGSLSDLDAAIAGARLGGDSAMWERLKNIRAARRGR